MDMDGLIGQHLQSSVIYKCVIYKSNNVLLLHMVRFITFCRNQIISNKY